MANRSLIDEVKQFDEFWWRFTAYAGNHDAIRHTEQERNLALIVWLARSVDEQQDIQTLQLIDKIVQQGVKNEC